MPNLRTSATAAAQQCCGGTNGRACGLSWSKLGNWDGTYGVGQQMAALEVIQGTLIHQVAAPVTNTTGGTSTGNYDAGIVSTVNPDIYIPHITNADRAGAGILTVLVVGGFMALLAWMLWEQGTSSSVAGAVVGEKGVLKSAKAWPKAVKSAVLTKSG